MAIRLIAFVLLLALSVACFTGLFPPWFGAYSSAISAVGFFFAAVLFARNPSFPEAPCPH